MLPEVNGVPLGRLLGLFAGLMAAGTLACLPLYSWSWRRLAASSVGLKIAWWIPIFGLFVAGLALGPGGQLGLVLGLLVLAVRDAWRVARTRPAGGTGRHDRRLIAGYVLIFAGAWLAWVPLSQLAGGRLGAVLVIIAFGSVMSDVVAFFFGRYLGRHKLPAALNANKSWEGVVGQLVGAGVGVALVAGLVVRGTGVQSWIWLPLGLGSAAGDLVNSWVKRRLDIKDWGTSLPGHGGWLDRLSSLAGAVAFTCAVMLSR